jgi:hypothetical protein
MRSRNSVTALTTLETWTSRRTNTGGEARATIPGPVLSTYMVERLWVSSARPVKNLVELSPTRRVRDSWVAGPGGRCSLPLVNPYGLLMCRVTVRRALGANSRRCDQRRRAPQADTQLSYIPRTTPDRFSPGKLASHYIRRVTKVASTWPKNFRTRHPRTPNPPPSPHPPLKPPVNAVKPNKRDALRR